MLAEILLCTIGAAGLLFFLWTVFGYLLLPLPRNCVAVFPVSSETRDLERQVRAFAFLKNSCILRGSLVLLDCGMPAELLPLVQQLCKEYSFVSYSNEREAEIWLNERNN